MLSDEERIKQLELEVKVLRANNKGLKDKIDEQSKEIEEAEQKERKAYIKGTNDADELCNKKWEDKIKAKIEEVDYKMIAHQDLRLAVKEALNSLLEKE